MGLKAKILSGVAGAPCTKELKKEARYQFEKNNKIDWHVLGFTVDEKNRSDRFMKFERENVIPILIDENLTKGDCFDILLDAGIKLPEIYKLGFPNANCIGCVKSQSPTYWNLVREKFPDIYKERAEQSRRIGCKLVKRKEERIFLDELKPTDKGGKLKAGNVVYSATPNETLLIYKTYNLYTFSGERRRVCLRRLKFQCINIPCFTLPFEPLIVL